MDDGTLANTASQTEAEDVLSRGLLNELQGDQKWKEKRFKTAHGILITLLLLFLLLHGFGIFLFTNGFLLTRLILEHKSECSTPPIELLYGVDSELANGNGCWHPKTFNKAVVLVIDALRYDFTVPFQPKPDDVSPHHFHESLKILYETAAKSPRNALLRPFIADAPTTTLQRLKGLTTGNLPTFIDAGSNFAGTSINEDNLIAQLASAGKTVVQLGDDTWDKLFPGLFDSNLSKPYDSFDVWDLFTVDSGVSEHLLPLLQPSNGTKWDVIIGHYLGVDHAGHRYGPDHPAMAGKLLEMDDVLRKVVSLIDNDTLLVVMGDHGMDVKGNHGGESDDEVEAALWMYSKREVFGRSANVPSSPPPTSKDRPVAQIDLVPTLALLLGLPIPFNNLGAPIEDVFIGPEGTDYKNYAQVSRLTAAQIHRYQDEYALVRKPDPDAFYVPNSLWDAATKAWERRLQSGSEIQLSQWEALAGAFESYQQHNLEVCKDLWSRFDIVSISGGIALSAFLLAIAFMYACSMRGKLTTGNARFVTFGSLALSGGGLFGYILGLVIPNLGVLRSSLFSGGMACCLSLGYTLLSTQHSFSVPLPRSIWSWTCVIAVLLLSLGFGANSFTIWEDEILLFLLATFGILMFTQAFRLKSSADRAFACYQSVIFTVMIRLASLPRLCREEQMPYCKSTFFASASSSTSAPWQLAIPYLIAIVLPTIIKTYYDCTSSYHASAQFWVGIAFRSSLFLIAVFWTLDAAADAKWLEEYMLEDTLKTVRMYIAQLVLAISAGAGVATFGWQSPLIDIEKVEAVAQQRSSPHPVRPSAKSNGSAATSYTTQPSKPQVMLHGTNNLYGSHFSILPFTVLLIPLLLLQKPMGQAALACITTAILSLLELLHFLRQPKLVSSVDSSSSTIPKTSVSSPSISTTLGPTILALLAHFAYFKTGHQATLASIQWDAAFVPLRTIRHPWSPIFMLLNTFPGHILCAAALPCVVLWRRPFDFKSSTSISVAAAEPTIPHETSHKAITRTASKAPEKSETPTDTSMPLGKSRSSQDENQNEALLSDLAKAYTRHILVYATINLATTVFAAHLRRHLMLYRVFCPRWMLGSVGMIVAEAFGLLVGVAGVRWTVGALAGLFGW